SARAAREQCADAQLQKALAQSGATGRLSGHWRAVAGRRVVARPGVGKEPVAAEYTAVGCIVLHPVLLSHSRRDERARAWRSISCARPGDSCKARATHGLGAE